MENDCSASVENDTEEELKSQIRTSKAGLIQAPKSRNMKGLTINIIATGRYGMAFAIKDEFSKRSRWS